MAEMPTHGGVYTKEQMAVDYESTVGSSIFDVYVPLESQIFRGPLYQAPDHDSVSQVKR